MEINIDVPEYNANAGFKFKWEPGFNIELKYEDDTVILLANKEGLISLANHFLNLAQDKVPPGYHVHLDDYNCLEEHSKEWIIEKKYS